MQQHIDPVKAFFVWYEKQDKEVQTDFAAFAVIASGSGVPHPDPSAALKAWFPGDATGLRLLGRIGILRTVMEICFAKQRMQPEFWARGAAMSTVLGAKVRSEGHADFAQALSSNVESIPKRQAIWASACSSWRDLADSALSDANLERWLDSAMRPGA